MESNKPQAYNLGQATGKQQHAGKELELAQRQRADTGEQIFGGKGGMLRIDDDFRASQIDYEESHGARSEPDLTSEEARAVQMLQMLQRLFDAPHLEAPAPSESQAAAQNPMASFQTVQVEFASDNSNMGVITNPRAVLNVLEPQAFLQSGLSESSQCEILDGILEIINTCMPNNALALMNLMVQPVESLKCDLSAFEQQTRLNQSDLVRQFISHNDLNLYKVQLQALKQEIRNNSHDLIEKYALKNTPNSQKEIQKDKLDFPQGRAVDILMLLIYLGCKLSSQQLLDAASRISHLCHILSEGYNFQRQHLEFLVQFVKQKSSKVLLMQKEVQEIKDKLQPNQTNNKITFQEQIIKEKQQKLNSILSFALSMIGSLTCNRKNLVNPQPAFQNENQKSKNFFYFSGSECGLEFSQRSQQQRSRDSSQALSQTSWPFQKGYTAIIKFKCLKTQGGMFTQSNQIENPMLQNFDPLNLPVLFNCFAEGYGGFECYLNPSYQVIYRVLPRNYSPPTVESNGVKVADVQVDQWNLLVIEHDKPYLARAQLIAIMNDRQSINLPMDYPKFDQKASITNINICKGMTSQLGYFALFKDHFNHLKKLVSQLIKLDNFDEIILKNEISLDQHFSDQNGSSTQSTSNFLDKMCLLYSPSRATDCQAFQCIQSKENQFTHQISNDLNAVFLVNSGVHVSKVKTDFDINQLLPFLEVILDQEDHIKVMVNQWLKIVSTQSISSSTFIESMFHIITDSMKKQKHNVRNYPQVDVDSINLLAEIRYQLLDEKSKDLHDTFFKCLIQSTDFWINQSLVKENLQTLNDQYWLLIKTIYAQDPVEYNRIFPIQILITLMNEIGTMYAQDAGAIQNCCFYHQKTSKLLSHESLKKAGGQKTRKLSEEDAVRSNEEFQIVDMPYDQAQISQMNEQQNQLKKQSTFLKQDGSEKQRFIFFQEGYNREINIEDREVDVQRLLEPITAVLETVLNASFGLFSSNKSQSPSIHIPNEILDSIKHICLALTSSGACPCFQLQMLKLLRLVLVDSKDQEISLLFAQKFIKEQGLQVLLYVCSISMTFDVKSFCIKIIDILCSSHTNLIKMIRIDTDLISYLAEILIPKNLDYDIDLIKKKRFNKLKLKRQAELEAKKKRNDIFGGKGNQIQIVDYQEDQNAEHSSFENHMDNQQMAQQQKFLFTQDVRKDLKGKILSGGESYKMLESEAMREDIVMDQANFMINDDGPLRNDQDNFSQGSGQDLGVDGMGSIAADSASRNDEQQHHIKLNSLEERQLDQLFGGGDEQSGIPASETRNNQQAAIRANLQQSHNSFDDDYQQQQFPTFDDNQEDQDIQRQFGEATGGLKMPPAPKSKVVPKFAFGDMSDSDAEEQPEERRNPKATKGGFDFGMMDDDSENDSPKEEDDQDDQQFKLPQKKFMDKPANSNHGNQLELNLDSNQDNQFMLQSQKLPGLKEFGFRPNADSIFRPANKKLGLQLQLSETSGQNITRSKQNDLDDSQDQGSRSQGSDNDRVEEEDIKMSSKDEQKKKSKFGNENTIANSNLRQKDVKEGDKTFNFGLAAGFSESSEGDANNSQNAEAPPQTVNFYDNQQQEEPAADKNSDEELEYHLMMSRKNNEKKKNPFASRIGNQELQPSQIRKNKQQAAAAKKVQMKKPKKLGLQLDDQAEENRDQLQQQPEQPKRNNLMLSLDDEENPPSTNLNSMLETEMLEESGRTGLPSLDFPSRDVEESKTGASSKSSAGPKKMEKKNFRPRIGLDIEAINELYTYGGEQGKKKESEENELMDFENGILELANQCLAAMRREKPSDPIIYDSKKSFEQKFQIENVEEIGEAGEKKEQNDDKPNYFRPNFNVPQTMRGIKNLALGIGIKSAGLKSKNSESQQQKKYGSPELEIEENEQEEVDEDEDMKQEAQDDELNQEEELTEEVILPQKDGSKYGKKKQKIIDYDLIQDQDDQGNNLLEPLQEDEKNFIHDKSHSQKSDLCGDYTANNSKLEKLESYEEISEHQRGPTDKNHFFGEEDLKKKTEEEQPENEPHLEQEESEDLRDQEFLEEFDNEQTTQELSNLYTSCLEWILSRPVSALNSQLMIDDYDKIQYPAALELLMNLVAQSNNLLRQRALLDFYMLAQWDTQNGHILLFHQKFHSWLLDLLLPYQQYIDEQDENCRAVYDMGCKLHTLLVTNSCINPEQEAFKKLNMISRYPLTVHPDKRTTAEKLSRVLLINLLNSLQPHLSQATSTADEPEASHQAGSLCAWRNFIHIIQLSEEMMYTSNSQSQSKQQEYDDKNDKNSRSINLNMSLLDWQRTHMMYFETGNVYDDNVHEVQWAEWEMLDTLFEGVEMLYKKLGIVIEDEKSEGVQINTNQLLQSQQYQVSTQIIQEKVYESLERFYQTSQFEQDIQLLMRECLVGSQITPRGNGIDSQQQIQAAESQQQSNQSKFSFPIGAGRLKNIKLQFQPQLSQSVVNQQQNQTQQLQSQKQQCLIDSIMNMLCTALVEGQTKEIIQKWLNKLENFMRYIMLLSETLNQQKSEQIYPKVQHKFSNVITFGFAFLFHQIHSTNFQQKQSPNQTQQIQLGHKKSIQISSIASVKATPTSSTSSPKDYQAINRMFALTLKNLVIYFVNIIDYKDLCKNLPGVYQQRASAVQHIFSKILVNKISDQESYLITLDDIKRYKATNFEDFPECFGNEDWKVTFFHNEEINQIVREQMSSQMIEELFRKRRQTYGNGVNEMNTRSEKTKEDIQKRIHSDTFDKISLLNEQAYDQKIKSKLQIYVQNIHSKQQYSILKPSLYQNKGFWGNYGPIYLKSTNQGFSGLGIKAFMKERSNNGFKFINNRKDIENKLFKQIDNSLDYVSQAQSSSSDSLFTFFEAQLSKELINEQRDHYIQNVKVVTQFNKEAQKEIIQVDCVLMKAFYQAKGTLVLTADELIFVYVHSSSQQPEYGDADVKNHDNLLFFKKEQAHKKLVKKFDLEAIREIQRRRFIGFKASLEIFMVDNSSYLLKFYSTDDRDNFAKKLLKQRGLNCKNLRYYDSLDPKKIIKKRELTDRWRQWRISNFSYLMSLNYLGGRSQNDLSQYPIFPWIFSNYSSTDQDMKLDHITFNTFYQRGDAPPEPFRDLSKNMQLLGTAERQAEFKNKYEDIDGFLNFDDRFHCGSHYSNPGITLHYLTRISPFIDALVELQGGSHDNPDRIFHSLQDSFLNALSDHSDVREILPEFFYQPELYLNLNKINFGKRQDQQLVDDISLPSWCEQNPYKFVVRLREALECNYVSQNICKWVDYIFGYKQLGPDAERSLNTYSGVSYEDRIDLEKIGETDPNLAESYKLQMYNYGQTPTNVVQFRTKEHPAKKYKEEIFKYNLVTDQFANLKVYRPVNKKKNQQDNNKASILSQIQQGRLPPIQRKAIIKAQFINEGLIAAARVDGKMRFYMWVNQANDLNPLTPFTCGKEKKKLYEYALSPVLLQNDFTMTTLNKPMLILNRGKIVLGGGHWDGQISVSYTQEIQQDRSQNSSLANQFTRSHAQQNSANPVTQSISALIEGHSTTCTVIASTIDDPNKIISKNQQNSSQASIQNDACTVITGSKLGDVIVWKFSPDQNPAPQAILSKQKHFFDHEDQVSSIFIHQDMQYFATSSFDGTCNLYNLWKLEIMRCFKHPSLNPLSTVILSNQPLVSLAMFSPVDRVWISFSINGQNLNELETEPDVLIKNYSEESSQIVAPKVIQNAYFMERLIYGTERGYIVIRELPFMAPLKRINISTNNLIQPVLTFIVSKDRRFLLVGCGEGGLTVITEPFSTSQQALKQQQKQKLQNQSITASSQQSSMQHHNTSSQISQGGQSSSQGKNQIGNSGSMQVSQISQATSRNDMQNASFVSSNATGQGTVHSNSYQKLSGTKNASTMQQSVQISNNMNSSSGTDTSLSISGGNLNSFINRSDQQNLNISVRQSIVGKKLGSKINAQPKTSQQVYDNHHYGGVQVGAQSVAILRSSDKKSPNGSNGSRNNSQAQASNVGKQAFQGMPTTAAGKLRINTSLSSAQRQNSTGKQRAQENAKNTNVIIGSNVGKVGGINFATKSNSSTGKTLNNAQIIGMAPHSTYSQTLKTQHAVNPYEERQHLKPKNQGAANPRSSVLTMQTAFQGIQQTMKNIGSKDKKAENQPME